MSNPPFCVDCTHRSKLLGSDMCNRPDGTLDLITGKPRVLYRLCTIERAQPFTLIPHITCAVEGKFFEQNTSVWCRIKKWAGKSSVRMVNQLIICSNIKGVQ